MTRRQRLRRVALLAGHTICNIACYRAGRRSNTFVRNEGFWIRVTGNFLDTALLEWSKLFADVRGAHFWKRVLNDPGTFETGLLNKLNISPAEFEGYINSVRTYRDKFVAHLDSELVANIPKLNVALESSEYLLNYLHSSEDEGNYLQGIPDNAEQLYSKTLENARIHYLAGAT